MRPPLLKSLKSQGFTLALIGGVLAAILYPDLGLEDGPLQTGITTDIAVTLIFLIQGLSLPTRQIAASVAKLRIHLFCQLSIFVAAPLLMLAMLALAGDLLHPGIYSGFVYLAVLPTTISSAIVMTSSSGGDSSTALFSTTLSNVIGIYITPTLCALLLATESESSLSLAALIGKLSLLVLMPLVVGQSIRPFCRGWAKRSGNRFKRLSNGLIVFIVYAAFCQSVASGIWTQVGAVSVWITIGFACLFLVGFSYLVWFAAALVTQDQKERIAIFFCGSQKTLASGVPMASVLFSGATIDNASLSTGLVILPLMCFHPMQLLLAGALCPRLAAWVNNR